MYKLIYVILLFSTAASCQTTSSDKVDAQSANNNSMFVKDSSDYSLKFLNELSESGMKDVSLVDSFMILGERDTISFPKIPKIGKRCVLTAKKGELAIALTIKRVNQTSIDYKIEMVEFGKANFTSEGQADLKPHFYFGSESDENSLTGNSYFSTEFSNNRDSCYTYIRLGREEDSSPYLLGKINKNCNGEIKDVELGNFPTLIEK